MAPPDSGATVLFELICGDYGEVPARVQRLRGPPTIRTALAVYDRRLGLAS